MQDSAELSRQRLDLEFLGNLLADAGVPYHYTPDSEEYALPFLSLEAGVPEEPDVAYLQLMYIPTATLLDETNLLQFFTYLPEAGESTHAVPESLLRYLNTRTAIGYFGTDADNKLFYRYVYALPRFSPPGKTSFLEVLDVYTGSLSAFGAKLLALQRGEIDEAAVREAI